MATNSAYRSIATLGLLLLWLALSPLLLIAQDNLTVEEQYEKARHAAFEEKNYDKARRIAYRALRESPDYHGIRIFIARLFAWEGNYPDARKVLQHVLEKDPDNRRALLTIIDVESWSSHYRKALEWTNKALAYYAGDEEFMLQKASILRKMKDYKQAEHIYRSLLDTKPSPEVREALRSLRLKQMKYSATLSYRHDQFGSIFDPWKFWEFQLSRQTSFGSVIGRLQYANRFSSDGVQFNLDAYPSLFKGMYAYISGGYSESSIYPQYRFGLSLYKTLPRSFELEGGLRYLDFTSSQTTIYTMSLSKYWGSYLFTGRTYLVPSSTGTSKSLRLLARRYFGDAETYFEVNGGFGSAAANIQFAEDIRRLDSWSIGIAGQLPLSRRIHIGGKAGYDSEQFANFDRKRYSFKMHLSYRF